MVLVRVRGRRPTRVAARPGVLPRVPRLGEPVLAPPLGGLVVLLVGVVLPTVVHAVGGLVLRAPGVVDTTEAPSLLLGRTEAGRPVQGLAQAAAQAVAGVLGKNFFYFAVISSTKNFVSLGGTAL